MALRTARRGGRSLLGLALLLQQIFAVEHGVGADICVTRRRSILATWPASEENQRMQISSSMA